MFKLRELFICLLLFVFGVLIWGYKMIIASDGPVNISSKEFIELTSIILIYNVFHYFYIKKLRPNLILLNLIFLMILLLPWFASLIGALTYNYQKYDTIIDIIGCISITSFIIIEFYIYRLKIKTQL
jgi:hypothetical protein